MVQKRNKVGTIFGGSFIAKPRGIVYPDRVSGDESVATRLKRIVPAYASSVGLEFVQLRMSETRNISAVTRRWQAYYYC